jgi:hypothetical protein
MGRVSSRWCWTLLVLVGGWLAAAALSAQITPTGSEVTVANSATFQAAPAAASSASGLVVVVWQRQNSSTGGWDIFGRQLNPSGPVGAEFQVNSSTAIACRQFPAVASDPAGNFVAAWQSDESGQTRIYGRRFDSTHQPLANEFPVNLDNSFKRQLPAVALAPDGAFMVTWQSDTEDGSSWGIFGQMYNGSGAGVGAQLAVNQMTAGAQHSPAVAYLTPGLTGDVFEVGWQSEGQGSGASGVFVRSFQMNGPAGAETAVNAGATDAQGHPRIAADPSGNYVVAWEGVTAAGSGIYFRRFNSSGTALSGALAADLATVGSQRNPAVASDALGNFVVSWDSLGQDGSGTAVLAQAFDNVQAPHGGKVQLNTTTAGDQSFAVPAASGGGDVWGVWQNQTAAGDSSDVRAQNALLPGLNFFTLMPCRLLDTRNPNGPSGGPILTAGQPRNLPAVGSCGIPAGAKSLALNVTVTGGTSGGSVTIYPGDAPVPAASTLNFSPGQTRANNAVMALSCNGDGSLEVRSNQALVGGNRGQVHVIVDVNGYFQ